MDRIISQLTFKTHENSHHTARARSLRVLSGNVQNTGPYYAVYIYIYTHIPTQNATHHDANIFGTPGLLFLDAFGLNIQARDMLTF